MTRGMQRATPAAGFDALIEEALVDAYNDEEQFEAWVVVLEEHLALPAAALVVGEEVTVIGFDREPLGEVVAKCRRKDRVYRINATRSSGGTVARRPVPSGLRRIGSGSTGYELRSGS